MKKRGLGREVHSATKRCIAGSPVAVVAAGLWSLSRIRPFRELLATGEAEFRALVDAMAEAAALAEPSAVADIRAMRPS